MTLNKILDKYPIEVENIQKRIVVDGEDLNDVIRDYEYIMKEENISALGLIHYVREYVESKKKDY